VPVQLTGRGFTPRTVLSAALLVDNRTQLAYVSPTELLCVIKNPQAQETITVQDPNSGQNPASIIVTRPKDKEKKKEETTITTVATEKKVMKN
jgi:hypothetical protein